MRHRLVALTSVATVLVAICAHAQAPTAKGRTGLTLEEITTNGLVISTAWRNGA